MPVLISGILFLIKNKDAGFLITGRLAAAREEIIKILNSVFPNGKLRLEGVIFIPDREGAFPAVVVCHPHPRFGGSMDNNVVDSLCQALIGRDIISFKFNFRGVGGSQGTYDSGVGEQDDVRAAVSFVAGLEEVDSQRIGLAGYSAGAAWGLEAACQDIRVKALAAISPPLPMVSFDFLDSCRKPKLMVCGTEDTLIPINLFRKFCQNLMAPKECYTVDGADHSWCGHEAIAAEKVASFFSKAI